MDFKEATDRLGAAGITHAEIGKALGIAGSTVRASRLAEDSTNYRKPPDGWREPLAELAAHRAKTLEELSRLLAR